MSYQLRSESTGIQNVHSIAVALERAKQDPTIWKISFTSNDGDRIRLVKNSAGSFELERICFSMGVE